MVSGVNISNYTDRVTAKKQRIQALQNYTTQAEMSESEGIQEIVNQVVI